MRSLLLVCLAASVASADGYYFTEGVGGTRVNDQLSHYMQTAARFRIAIGRRVGQWAVEGWVAAAVNPAVVDSVGKPDLTMYGVDLKYLQPISRHVELYLRGSMSGAQADGELDGYAGRGLGFGAGIQLEGKVPALGFLFWPLFLTNYGPKVTGALWLDTGYEFYRLHGPAPVAIDAELTHLTAGFAIGSDF